MVEEIPSPSDPGRMVENPDGHVVWPNFGLNMRNRPGPVDMLVDLATQPLDPIQVSLLLREFYDNAYGIYDHDGLNQAGHEARPLALVGLHPKEQLGGYSKLHRFFRRFEQMNIRQFYGYTAAEFLKLPHDIVELYFTMARERMAREKPALDKAAAAMQQAMSDPRST